MDQNIFQQLQTAYSLENLNQISRHILDLYRNKNFMALQNLLSNSEALAKPPISGRQLFSKLMMLYHPDKFSFYQSELFRLKELQDHYQWQNLLPIISVLKTIKQTPKGNLSSPGFVAKYEWENQEEHNLHDGDQEEDYGFNDFTASYEDLSFYAAFKRQQYGERNVEMPTFLLEDIDELEMSSLNIEDLDGVQYCGQLVKLDLSCNNIYDLAELGNLRMLQELYLSDNQISWVDPLENLQGLRILDLSGNSINDIQILVNLENLEYLDLTGNPVPEIQINQLKEKNIIVII